MKQFLTAILIITSTACYSQAYVGMEANNKGVGINAGVVAQQVDVKLGYNMPIIKATVPSVLYLSTGYQVILDNKDDDHFTCTPAIGITQQKVKDFSENSDGVAVTSTKMLFSTELAKDWHMGRLYINANYSGMFYAGAGIRIFFK